MSTSVRRRFGGVVLPVGELVARSQAQPEPDWAEVYGTELGNDAADAAAECHRLIGLGEPLLACWRYGVLQAVDYYDSARRRGGLGLAAQVFGREPAPTGAAEVDAAFAALAEHLAVRDGWTTPKWAMSLGRTASAPWYVVDVPAYRAIIEQEAPPAFRQRGVFISAHGLDRA